MSMRSQVYEWDSANYGTGVALPAAGRSVSIFVGGFGNNITKPAETTATEFVVIEDIAVTPSTSSAAAAGGSYRGLLIATAGTGVAGPRARWRRRRRCARRFCGARACRDPPPA